MSKARLLVGCVAIVLLFISSESLALQAVLAAGDLAVISNPEDASAQRVIVKYEIPQALLSAEIIYAQLEGRVNATSDGDDIAMAIEAAPLVEDWDPATVTWLVPWRVPGGDADLMQVRHFLVRQGLCPLRIDVTSLVRQWANGSRRNYGLMLRTSPHSNGHMSLPTAAGADGGGLSVPSIRVWYLPASE